MISRTRINEMAYNSYKMNEKIEKQTEMEEENLEILQEQVKQLYRKMNEIQNVIAERENEKTITISYKEYMSLQQKENELNRMKEDMKDFVKEYNSYFEYHNVKIQKYGESDWYEITLPLSGLSRYEYLLQEENR